MPETLKEIDKITRSFWDKQAEIHPDDDIFTQHWKAELAFLLNQTDRLYRIYKKIRHKALKTFNETSLMDGGKEIRVPLSYQEDN